MCGNPEVIHQLLKAIFKKEEDIAVFCFDYFRNIYRQFREGMGDLVKLQLLISHVKKDQAEFDRLLDLTKEKDHDQLNKISPQPERLPRPQAVNPNIDGSNLTVNPGQTRLELTLPINFDGATPEQRTAAIAAAVGALAGVLGIPSYAINVLEVRIGK